MKKVRYAMIALSLLLAACKGEAGQTEERQAHDENIVRLSEAQMSAIGIQVGQIEQRQLSGTINATGALRLAPQDRAEVTSLLAGIARRILVKEGQTVSLGQTLALVENTEIVALQKDYLVASRRLALARQAWQRQQNLHDQGAGVEKNLEQARAEHDIASATERGLRLQLEQMGISPGQVAQGAFSNTAPVRSPIAGVVGEILISTGSHLDGETVLMRVYDNRALHADLHVFETDIARIQVGQSVSLQLSDREGTHLTGRVSFITATLDDDSKSASVHVELDRTAGVTLMPNMFVSAAIHTAQQTCNTVPDEAIVASASRRFVFVSLGDGRFLKKEVVTGLSQHGYTQIAFVDGTESTAPVVISQAFYLESVLADHGEEE